MACSMRAALTCVLAIAVAAASYIGSGNDLRAGVAPTPSPQPAHRLFVALEDAAQVVLVTGPEWRVTRRVRVPPARTT